MPVGRQASVSIFKPGRVFVQHEHDRLGMGIRRDPADPEPLGHARIGGVVFGAADEITAFDVFFAVVGATP